MKKIVVKVEVSDEKGRQKALKAVSGLSGMESLAMDMKDKKLTVVGDVDPVVVVNKLRKSGLHAVINSVGPAKEEKKDDGKKEGPKKEEKKDDGKKEEPKKVEKKDVDKQVEEMVKAYQAYRPYYTTHYNVHSWEDDPNKCVIC